MLIATDCAGRQFRRSLDRLGHKRAAIQKQLRELERLKFIETTPRLGQSNCYRILHDLDLSDVQDRRTNVEPKGQRDVAGGQPDVAGGADARLAGGAEATLALTSHRTTQMNGQGVFERFWASYPSRKRHSNPKTPAARKFEAAVKHGADPEAIIRGAKNYAVFVVAEKIESRFIAQAVTFLNQERWNEYQEPQKQNDERWQGWL